MPYKPLPPVAPPSSPHPVHQAPAHNERLSAKVSDLQGLSRLAVQGVLGLSEVVEGMHHAISRPSSLLGRRQSAHASGLTGFIYRSIRGTTRLVGAGLEQFWALLPIGSRAQASSPQRDAALAVLNGLWGDELVRTGNPLAIAMSLRINAQPYTTQLQTLAQRPSGKVLVLVHGLCMNDRQWQHKGHDHGQDLAQCLGYTPVYAHYNTGRHVSDNGADLALQLQDLLCNWPVPVQEIVLLGHSMGGLVCRSALAQGEGQPWFPLVKKLIMLGTPHQGAPLERGGNWLDMALALSPYAAPLAQVSKARSAGITDLRYGNVLQADWQGRDRYQQRQDLRQPCPLPNTVASYTVAATTSLQANGLRHTLVGDGLVPLASALGDHRNPQRSLQIPSSQRLVITQANHWDLLSHPKVFEALKQWLK